MELLLVNPLPPLQGIFEMAIRRVPPSYAEDDMARLESSKERIFAELEYAIVPLGKSCVIHGGLVRDHRFPLDAPFYDQRFSIKALRVDAVIDDGPDGYARGFAFLLAGFRAELRVGEKSTGVFTFVNGLLNGQTPTAPQADIPFLGHGVIGPLPQDIVVLPRQTLAVRASYDGPDLPIAFLRVMILGMLVRDIA